MRRYAKNYIRYSIRKYSVGVVSVFIAAGIFSVVNSGTAHASENSETAIVSNKDNTLNNKLTTENVALPQNTTGNTVSENATTSPVITNNVANTNNVNNTTSLRSANNTKVVKTIIPLDANNNVLIDTTNNNVVNVKVIYTDGSSEVKTQDNTTTYIAKNRDNITEKVNTVKSSFETINYMDLYSAMNNPYISNIEKIAIRNELKKQTGVNPTEQQVEEVAKRNYMDALNMESSFNNVKSNLTTNLTAIFENSTNINTTNVINNKNKIMLGLTFLERQYGFDFNGVKAKDLILYYPEVFSRDGEALVNVINIANMPASNLQLFRSAEAYKSKIAPIVNISDVVSFIERGAEMFANKSGEQFLKDTTKAIIEETTSEHGSSSIFKKIKKEESLKNHLIPLLSLPSDSIYVISTTNTLNYGVVDSYIDPSNVENSKNEFLVNLKRTAEHQQKFLDFWYRITNKKTELKNHNTIIVKDSYQKYSNNRYATARSLWSPKTGEQALTGVREFITPMNLYTDINSSPLGAEGQASGNIVTLFTLKSLVEKGITVYTHELTHILDQKIWFDGYKRRIGKDAEVFARGLFESINNKTFGGGFTKPAFNLNTAYTLGENRVQNASPERFKTEADIKQYMQGLLDVIYTLDYAEALVSLEKTSAEKAILFNKVSYIPSAVANKFNDRFEHVTEAEAGSLNSINDLITNNIVSGRLEYKGISTTGDTKQNDYMAVPLFEPVYAALQNDNSSTGDFIFKRNSYDLLGEYGYTNGMIPYLSNQYNNDSEALNAILDSKYNGNLAEFKKDMFARRIEKVVDLKSNEHFTNFDDLLNKMRVAVTRDLATMTANKARNTSGLGIATGANEVRNLKEKILNSYLRSTNDFTESIYNAPQPKIIYVNNRGNELSQDGLGSEQAPYESLRYAISKARDGDTIKLVENVTTRTLGYNVVAGETPTFVIDKAITIDGNNNILTFRGFDLELTKNVEFKNVNLKLMPDGNKDTKIYLSGNEVTFNNVNTKISDYSSQDSIRPTIVGGAKNDEPTGQHAKINIINGDSETRFKKIIAGDDDNDLYIPVTININSQHAKVDNGIILGGDNNFQTTEKVTVISNSRYIQKIDGQNNILNEVILNDSGYTLNDIQLIDIKKLTLGSKARVELRYDTTIAGDLILENGSKLWIRSDNGLNVENATVNGEIIVYDKSSLNINGDLTNNNSVKIMSWLNATNIENKNVLVVNGAIIGNEITTSSYTSDKYIIQKDANSNSYKIVPKNQQPTTRDEEIDFGTIYREDITKDYGYESITLGEKGIKTYTTGADGVEDQGVVTKNPKDKIVIRGTKPSSVVTPINYNTVYRADETQDFGYINETGGVNGTSTVVTNYTLNPQTGEITSEQGQPVIVNPVDKVITKGTKQKVERINEVEKNTIYEIDVNSNEVAGTKISETAGQNGYTTKTTTYTIDTDGNIIPSVNEVVTPKVDKVITISGKQKVEREVLEKGITYVADNEKDTDYIDTVEGTNGEIVKTTTYTINSQTGQLIPNETTQKTDKVNTVITKGTKPKVERINEVEKNTIYEIDVNSNEVAGTKISETAGQNGYTTKTTTYTIDTDGNIIPSVNEVVTPKVDKVITISGKQKVEREVLEKGITYVADNEKDIDYINTVEGSNGEIVKTTTYTINSQTGQLIPNETTQKTDKVNTVITKGTKQKVERINEVEKSTIYRANENSQEVAGVKTTINEGQNGYTTRTTTYKLNEQTGEISSTTTESVTNKIDKEVEVSTKPLIETINEIEKNTIYEIDVNSNEVAGTIISETAGQNGYTTKTTTYTIDTDGNIIPSVNEVVTPKVDKVITISGKQKVEKEVLEKGITYVADNEKDIDYINTVEGSNGEIVKTTTYTINSQTGQLIPNETIQKTDKVNTVITKGTKPKVEETVIPKQMTYSRNDEKVVGDDEVVQGTDGKTIKTITYSLNETTGEVTSSENIETQDKVDSVTIRGTKPKVETEILSKQTIYVADENKEVGYEHISNGADGTKTTTTTYSINENGEVVANTPQVEVVDKVDTIITKGTKPKVEETKIPKVVKYVADENKEYGSENEIVKIGKEGKTTKTTTYNLDINTGIITENQPVTSTENATEEIIKVGTKPTKRIVAEELTDNDFETQNDSTIPLGKVIEIPGENGERTFTDTYTLDENTGVVTKIEDTVGSITKEKVKKIIKIGTGKNIVTPRNTVYRANPEKELGFEEETDAGEDKVVDVQGNVISSGRDRVITKGTKPTTETTEQNFTTRYVADDTKDRNYRSETEGTVGTTSITTTYSVNEQTGEVTSTPGQPNVVPPVEKIITLGTKPTTETTEQNFATRYVADATKEVGYISETGGVVGTTNVTTTYKVNSQTGEITSEQGQPVIVNPVDKVITKGTKQKVERINEVEKSTIYRANENSQEVAGVKTTIKEGSNGYTTRTTTYTLNEQTGEISSTTTENITNKIDKEVEVSTKPLIETINEIEKNTVYEIDVNSNEVAGTKISETEGSNGYTKKTTTYTIDTNGNIIPSVNEVVTPKVDKVITISGKPKKEIVPINYITKYVADENKDFGDDVESGGVNGEKEEITTYSLDSSTGKLISTTTSKTLKDAVEKIVTKGTKTKKAVVEVKYETKYVYDNTKDTTYLLETAGVNGEKEEITTYSLNETTGEITKTVTSKILKEAIAKVITVGNKRTEENITNQTQQSNNIQKVNEETKEINDKSETPTLSSVCGERENIETNEVNTNEQKAELQNKTETTKTTNQVQEKIEDKENKKYSTTNYVRKYNNILIILLISLFSAIFWLIFRKKRKKEEQ